MFTSKEGQTAEALLDKRRLQAVGVLVPIRLHSLSCLPGRHPLGRAGEGMRFLRTRPFEAGQDNPRDIDKFSPMNEYWVTDWESEAQAAIRVYADISGSMSFGSKAAIRNLALLQMTYSLWRSSDRVRIALFSQNETEEIAERNLKSQLEKLIERLGKKAFSAGDDAFHRLEKIATTSRSTKDDLLFIVSDFCPVAMTGVPKGLQQWRVLLRRMYCDIVPVIITFALPSEQRGTIKLWDPERQKQKLTLLTPSRIRRINAQEARRVAELQVLFRSLGLDYLTLQREHDVYPALARLASLRRRRSK